MTGKDYVLEALSWAEQILREMDQSDGYQSEQELKDTLGKALKELHRIKNRPTLRTKSGTNLALPVWEAARDLKEEWEALKGAGTTERFQGAVEAFASSVEVLCGALKDRTVIMT